MKEKLGIFLIWFLTFLLLGSAGVVVWFYWEMEKLIVENEQLSSENISLNNKWKRVDGENKTLTIRMDQMVIESKRLSEEYASIKGMYDETRGKYEAVLKDKDSLALEVKGLRQVKVFLYKKVKKLEAELAKLSGLEEDIKLLLGRLKLERAVKEVRPGEVELREIIVKAEPEDAGALLRRGGRVIATNDEYNFVVISLGEEQGVEAGMEFSVYRKGRRIGKIKVIELRRHLSACNIEEARGRGGIDKNDVVIPKLKKGGKEDEE